MSAHGELLSELKRLDVVAGLNEATTQKLSDYASALSSSQAFGHFGERQYPQLCETVRTHLLSAHVRTLQDQVVKLKDHVTALHDHISDLDKKNTTLQKLVVALTVASLVGTAAQVWYAAQADKAAVKEATVTSVQQQKPETKPSNLSQAAPPIVDRPKQNSP